MINAHPLALEFDGLPPHHGIIERNNKIHNIPSLNLEIDLAELLAIFDQNLNNLKIG
ncbi:MAG: hypothetical protein ACTSYI_07420 [Promethearchaeota archaeon]